MKTNHGKFVNPCWTDSSMTAFELCLLPPTWCTAHRTPTSWLARWNLEIKMLASTYSTTVLLHCSYIQLRWHFLHTKWGILQNKSEHMQFFTFYTLHRIHQQRLYYHTTFYFTAAVIWAILLLTRFCRFRHFLVPGLYCFLFPSFFFILALQNSNKSRKKS